MIRRAFLGAAAAAALILTPSVALAADYSAPGFPCSVSLPTPTVGTPFKVNASGFQSGEAVSLAVTGRAPVTQAADATGAVTFSVTIDAIGTWSLTTNNAAGTARCSQSVEGIEILGQEAVGASASGTPGNTAGQGELAATGQGSLGLAVGGGVLVLVGAGAVLVTRRRKSAKVPA